MIPSYDIPGFHGGDGLDCHFMVFDAEVYTTVKTSMGRPL
jgi:hypothetical protein